MVFTFIIDDIVNQYLPNTSIGKYLPKYISRFLGYHKPKQIPDYLLWIEIFLSTFVGILMIEGVFMSTNVFTDLHHAPIILASYGATAILCYNVSSSPLAQPRNVFFGHFVAALVGLCIQKLFSLSETGQQHYYLSGALSVSVASVLITILNCPHPPAGASALLPSIDEQVRQMSWWYLPVQIISAVLMISVACIMGNILRVYPTYWWSPSPLGSFYEDEVTSDEMDEKEFQIIKTKGTNTISITVDDILVPEELDLDEIKREWLNTLKMELIRLNSDNV